MVSTNCRGCNTYLKIEKGQAIAPHAPTDQPRFQSQGPPEEPAPPQETAPPAGDSTISPLPPEPKKRKKTELKKAVNPTPPFPKESPRGESKPDSEAAPLVPTRNPLPKKPSKPKAPPPPPKPEPVAESPAPEEEKSDPTPETLVEKTQPEPLTDPAPERYHPPEASEEKPAKPKISPLISRDRKRDVKCFECHQEHEILADSKSALCPHCGAYIALKDYDIRDQHNSRIQTRGNVFVHKKGYITGITIQAHNLVIEGEIQGGAECTGDFVVRKNGKINGAISSDRVIIERRAEVDFLSTVQAREVIIDGHVTGAVACKKLVLKKRATLDGDLTVASLSVEDGAKHTGKIQMTGLI